MPAFRGRILPAWEKLNTTTVTPASDVALGGEDGSLCPACEHPAIIKPYRHTWFTRLLGLDKTPASCPTLVDDEYGGWGSVDCGCANTAHGS